MIKDLIFGKTILPWLGKGLDAMTLRQKGTAENLANSQTPGYRRKLVTFEEELHEVQQRLHHRERLFRTHPHHLNAQSGTRELQPEMRLADERRDGPGAEEVVVEREMSDLAETQLTFEAEAKLAQTQFEMLKMAIRGSR